MVFCLGRRAKVCYNIANCRANSAVLFHSPISSSARFVFVREVVIGRGEGVCSAFQGTFYPTLMKARVATKDGAFRSFVQGKFDNVSSSSSKRYDLYVFLERQIFLHVPSHLVLSLEISRGRGQLGTVVSSDVVHVCRCERSLLLLGFDPRLALPMQYIWFSLLRRKPSEVAAVTTSSPK